MGGDLGAEPVLVRRLRTDELLYAWVGDRNTPMQIALLGVFDGTPFRRADGTPDTGRVRAELAARARRVPQLRQRVRWTRFGEGRPFWLADAGDPLGCITSVPLPPGADLPEWAANRAARGLRRDGPPWRVEVVDGLPEGGFAVLIVVSHVLADGLAGVALAGALLDPAPDVPTPLPPQRRPVPPPPSSGELVRLRLRELVARPHRARVPRRSRVRPGARQIREALAAFAGPEAVTPLPRRIGPGRRLAVARQPLEELERAGHALGVTVNDLLLAAVAGGLRGYLAARGPVPPGVVVRAMVPAATGRAGRQVSAVLVVRLPVGEPDPLRRLAAVHDATTAAKAGIRSTQGDATDLPLPLVVGRWIVRSSRRYGSRRMTLAVTDVPGPRTPLWLAGARLRTAVPIAPMSPLVPLSVAALSYAGELTVSINADASATGLDELARGTARGFAELVEHARAATP